VQVAELQRLDSLYKDQLNLAIQMAEKLVAGKINRQQYLDGENGVNSKREDIYQKMEALRASL
jgi:oligosaccharyltransferase complex subunit alpha (ribophorin I)